MLDGSVLQDEPIQDMHRRNRVVVDTFLTAMDVRSNPHAYRLQFNCLKEEVAEFAKAFDDWVEPEEQPSVEVFEELLKEYGDVQFCIYALNILESEGFATDPEWEEYSEFYDDNIGDSRIGLAISIYAEQARYYDLLEDTIKEITRSNLSKLDDNGKPIRRDDGKVLKGPNYSPANMGPIARKLLQIQ